MAMASISRRDFLRSSTATALLAAGAPLFTRAADVTRRPNIVFILADDLGWMDTAVYGSTYYRTPNIDRLAQRGMRFTSAYAANPLCSPTRASILTGQYPARLRITSPAGHLPAEADDLPWLPQRGAAWQKVCPPRVRRFLPLSARTIAETFKAAGYATAFVGKWHLGATEEFWPDKQGFDVNIAGGGYPSPPSYFSPYRIKTLPDGPKGEYIADRLTDEAIGYLRKHQANSPDQPVLMCLWHYSVHAPFQAPANRIEPYKTRTDPSRRQGCATMAGMIASLDASVGRILDALDELRLADNTIIVFTSDNGGNMYDRVEGLPPTNNAPLRNGKGNLYEGGVREPALVVAPGRTKPGSLCDHPIQSIDYYPTLLELAGVAPPAKEIIDGVSFADLLAGGEPKTPRDIFCHFPHYVPATGNRPGCSVRRGDWKLYRFFGDGPDRADRFELYDLKADLSEATNLADKHPDRVRQMDARISAHLQAVDALVPPPNPAYDPKAPDAMKDPTILQPRPPVQGWRGTPATALSVQGDRLIVQSLGDDPHLSAVVPGRPAGPVTVRLRLRLALAGNGQVFWSTPGEPAWAAARSAAVALTHDDQWHDYEVKLPVKGVLTGLRLDPGQGRGRAEIQSVRLFGPDEKVLGEWTFQGPTSAPDP